MKPLILFAACGVLAPVLGASVASGTTSGAVGVRILVLYDNYVFMEGTRSDWGFSCLVELGGETILFDTGTDPDILRGNIERLGVRPAAIDRIVISHQHGDHTGGLMRLLEDVGDVPVYLPDPSPRELVARIEATGSRPVPVREPRRICEGAHLTGTLEGRVPEHALVLETAEGTVLVTGCSHPGIERLVRRTRDIVDEDIRLVLGGFHLMHHSRDQLRSIVEVFRACGVKACAPTHCTGDDAIAFFHEAYGDRCLKAGTGRVFEY